MQELVFDTPMLVSAIILIVTFVAIFTEGVHQVHRTKTAMAGAAAMVIAGQIFGFYSPDAAVEAIDWNVVFLLGGMMAVVAIMIPTGGFDYIANKIANVAGGNQFFLMAMLGTAVTVLSLLLDNVTTVVIFGPLIVIICNSLKVNPIPYLLAAALLSDTGGVATLVGDPPNLMIGSAADIDFNTFFQRMGGIVFVAWIGTLVFLRFLFRKEFAITPQKQNFSTEGLIKDKRTWYTAIAVLIMMVFLFIFHHAIHWEAWVVAAFGLTVLMGLTTHTVSPDEYFTEVELSLLMFFVSLFVIVGGVEHSKFLQYIGSYIQPFVEKDIVVAAILLMWMSAIFSAAIDNIPFTAAMIPIILGMEAQGINVTPLWWCLAIGVGMGGNGTHLGSTANVFIVTLTERIAKQTGDHSMALTPGKWIRKGTPVMLLTLVLSSIGVYLFFDFFAAPIHTP